MSERIQLHVGPAPSAIAREWIANRRQLIDAARRAPDLAAHGEVLELLETILGLWVVETDRSETFDWTFEMQADVLLLIARYWLDLGQITPEERAAMGAPLAPPEIEAFTAVVVRGMIAALREAGPAGRALLDRLGV